MIGDLPFLQLWLSWFFVHSHFSTLVVQTPSAERSKEWKEVYFYGFLYVFCLPWANLLTTVACPGVLFAGILVCVGTDTIEMPHTALARPVIYYSRLSVGPPQQDYSLFHLVCSVRSRVGKSTFCMHVRLYLDMQQNGNCSQSFVGDNRF